MRAPVKPVYNHTFRTCYLVSLLWVAFALQNFVCAQTPTKPGNTGEKVDATGCPTFSFFEITCINKNVCQGDYISFGTSTGSIGGLSFYSFDWYVDGVLMQSGSSSFKSNLITDSSKVWGVVHYSSTGNCAGGQATSNTIDGFYLMPWRLPAISITSSQTGPLCAGSAITYAATPVDGGNNPTYIWQVNGVQITSGKDSIFTTTSLKNGDQVNCLLYIPGGVCLLANNVPSNSITAQFLPPVTPTPSVSITASTDDVYYGTPITFTATATNTGTTTNYQWQVNGVNAGTDSASFTTGNLNNGDKVTCIISTQEGCTILTGSNVITVTIKPPPPITIPNTFTPNGDGINDTWKISGLSFYPNIVVKVFNRLGTIVYQSRGYSTPWDGTSSNNRPLPDGVYYYVIYPDDKSAELSGWLAIIR